MARERRRKIVKVSPRQTTHKVSPRQTTHKVSPRETTHKVSPRPTKTTPEEQPVMGSGVRHRDVGHYQFSLFAVPEGDHYHWQVNRMNLDPQNMDRFGEKLAEGMARDEAEAWTMAEAWLDDYLRGHPGGA